MNALVIVNYECPHFLEVQLPLVQKFMPHFDVYVIETSAKEKCHLIASRWNAWYIHLGPYTTDFSHSHARALRYGYFSLLHYNMIGFLDHDCFPIKHFLPPMPDAMPNFIASTEVRGDVRYPNPACMFINTKVGHLDFSPSPGLDTCGGIAHKYTNVQEMKRTEEDGAVIYDDTFIHIVKGSNWCDSNENAERVKRVFERVKTYL